MMNFNPEFISYLFNIINSLEEENFSLRKKFSTSGEKSIMAQVPVLENLTAYQGYFEMGSIGNCVTSPDKKWVAVNNYLCKLLGYSRAEFLELSWADLTHPEDIEKDLVLFQQVIDGKRDTYELDKRFIGKDGTTVFTTLNVSCKRNSAGSVVYFYASIIDITARKIAEETLKHTNEYLSLATQAGGVGIWRIDAYTNALTWDEQMFILYGYSQNCVLPPEKVWDMGIHKEDLPRLMEALQLALNGKNDFHQEFRVIWPDGSLHYLSARAKVNRDMQGNPTSIIGTNHDISRFKNVEANLKKFYQAVEQSPVSILLTDLVGNIEYVNQAFLNITGYSHDEIIGKKPNILKSGINSNEFYVELWSTITSGSVWQGNFRNKKKNGELFWENASISSITDDLGNRLSYLAIKEDVTAQRNIEIALKESEEQHRLLFETAQEGIMVTKGKQICYFNPMLSIITGYPPDILLNFNFLDFVFPEDRFEIEAHYNCCLDGDEVSKKCTLRFLTLNGDVRWVEMSGAKLLWQGEPAILNFINDITEQKIAELDLINLNEELRISRSMLEDNLFQQNSLVDELTEIKEKLELSNQQKDKFFSIIAHDLRSPFSGFLGLTQMISEEAENLTVEELSKLGHEMYNSATNLYNLLKNLLEWAQMQRGVMHFDPVETSLPYLVFVNIDVLRQRCLQKSITINNQMPDSLHVLADEKMLNSVILNLLTNAVKFTKSGGEIIIRAEIEDDQMVKVSIHDNGVGIAKEILQKLFNISEKTGTLGTEGEPSSGLGLVLCKEFIVKHGGQIWVDSIVGQGSTFYFTVPVVLPMQ